MADGNTINRREICKKYDLSIATLRNIIVFNKALNFPEPTGYEGQSMIYNTKVVDDWFAGNPLKETKLNNHYTGALKTPSSLCKQGLKNDEMLRFLTGKYDSPYKQQRQMLRKIAARNADPSKRIIVTTQEIGFIPATNHWKGLI